MKNIHVLPTDKPSRLFEIFQFNFVFDKQNIYSEEYKKLHSYKNQNIYITSDEEIKEGDYFIAYSVTIDKKPYISCASEYKERKKEKGKIILTTDVDLIKDGVQAIDDEFLEWFVKNPNCEEVDIELEIGSLRWSNSKNTYKIIVPKKEPKQDMKQTAVEWLEKEIEKFHNWKRNPVFDENCFDEIELDKSINQAKEMEKQQQGYSEEEVIELLKTFDKNFNSGIVERNKGINEWFEQFKNK